LLRPQFVNFVEKLLAFVATRLYIAIVKKEKENKDDVIRFRITETERDFLKKMSEATGLTYSELMRTQMFERLYGKKKKET
jgi:16S rRNA U516 pseudouridylate synthase RsuA-like enzyme